MTSATPVDGRHGWRRWRDAMATALYGPGGFYRRSGAPGAHFRTAAHTSPLWAAAIASLAERVGGRDLVEVGAGGGELLTALSGLLPGDWRLVGVDVAPRPPALPGRVQWRDSLDDEVDGLLLAVEWLDVVPVDVVERADDGLRYVEVRPDGAERLGGPVDGSDAAWLQRWWPLADVGDRAEVGRPRDEAWAATVARLRRGVAVAVDYAAVPGRDVAGTLTGYRAGRQVPPVPDGRCDLTAHVLLESCAAAAAGPLGRGGDDRTPLETALTTQRGALAALGVSGTRPAYAGDPREYLRRLSAAGDAAELLDPGGLGGFTWLVQARGTPLPIAV